MRTAYLLYRRASNTPEAVTLDLAFAEEWIQTCNGEYRAFPIISTWTERLGNLPPAPRRQWTPPKPKVRRIKVPAH